MVGCHTRRRVAGERTHREVEGCNRPAVEGYSLPARPGAEYSWSGCPRRVEGCNRLGVEACNLPARPRTLLPAEGLVVGLPVVQVVAGKTFAGLLSSWFSLAGFPNRARSTEM